MRTRLYLITGIFSISTIFLSCNKNNQEIKISDLRLIGTELKNQDGIHRTNLGYDASGRITSITYEANGSAPVTRFNISYANNEIVIVEPPVSHVNADITDTIRLFLDANNRVVKRINHFFFEAKAPANPPQRTYVYDTTFYQYDAAGLPLKEIFTKKDSTWFNNGGIATYFYFTSGVTTYTVTNGNLTSSNYSDLTTLTTTLPTNTFSEIRTSTSSLVFEYTKSYPNNTDFSNAAVLREISIFTDFPLNPHYSLLPNKVSGTNTQKDGNGTILSTDNFTRNEQFSYNAFRFVSSKMDPANTESTVKYLYGKP